MCERQADPDTLCDPEVGVLSHETVITPTTPLDAACDTLLRLRRSGGRGVRGGGLGGRRRVRWVREGVRRVKSRAPHHDSGRSFCAARFLDFLERKRSRNFAADGGPSPAGRNRRAPASPRARRARAAPPDAQLRHPAAPRRAATDHTLLSRAPVLSVAWDVRRRALRSPHIAWRGSMWPARIPTCKNKDTTNQQRKAFFLS